LFSRFLSPLVRAALAGWLCQVCALWTQLPAQEVSFGEQIALSGLTNYPLDILTPDLDGDGDPDVLSACADERRIFWYENLEGPGDFSAQRHILTGPGASLEALWSADIDGDEDQDLVASYWEENQLLWYEHLDGSETFGEGRFICLTEHPVQAMLSFDVDDDGDQDLVCGGVELFWIANLDGLGHFGSQHMIDEELFVTRSLATADLDGDGDRDLLSTSTDAHGIVWYENLNGSGSFGEQQVISSEALGARSVGSADLDGDGDADVLSASHNDDKIAWYENTDGAGSFGPQRIITDSAEGAGSVAAADLDGDGALDVASCSRTDDTVAWFENRNGLGDFGHLQVIETQADDPHRVVCADLDGDGDSEVLTVSDYGHALAWYENTDGLGSFGGRNLFSALTLGAGIVEAADLDGDLDLDLLFVSSESDEVGWFENLDGAGNYSNARLISVEATGISKVASGDLDCDGDLDVLHASLESGCIAWVENLDGTGAFGNRRVVAEQAGARSVDVADLDGDGDPDILSACPDGLAAWYENRDGRGSFGMRRVIGRLRGTRSVVAADLDHDGDLDVAAAGSWTDYSWPPYESDGLIVWYRNLDGKGLFGEELDVAQLAGANRVHAADLDGDGDQDLLATAFIDVYSPPTGNKVAWFENQDGMGFFGPRQSITLEAIGARDVYSADLDNDGDQDVVSASSYDGEIAWYENLKGRGEFSSRRIVSSLADGARCVRAGDLDSDGDMDLASASMGDNKIAWYRNELAVPESEAATGGGRPSRARLLANHPNPFNASTRIDFQLFLPGRTRLALYDLGGRLVKVLVDRELPAGLHRADFNGAGLASGVYVYRLETGDRTQALKMLLVK